MKSSISFKNWPSKSHETRQFAHHFRHYNSFYMVGVGKVLTSSLFTGVAIMIHLGQDFPASQGAHQKNQPLQKLLNGRMDLQYNDYPILGPNPRHTPKPTGKV
ncbi:unnamed protein product [Citrullus colocynthis]|uniref:Uncharacterized protein n=1 Tax=Citrullus colocynthis TaxID=252529 RepID=A0ABP0Y8B0_9ROSI